MRFGDHEAISESAGGFDGRIDPLGRVCHFALCGSDLSQHHVEVTQRKRGSASFEAADASLNRGLCRVGVSAEVGRSRDTKSPRTEPVGGKDHLSDRNFREFQLGQQQCGGGFRVSDVGVAVWPKFRNLALTAPSSMSGVSQPTRASTGRHFRNHDAN